MARCAQKSVALCELFSPRVEARCGDLGLALASPREAAMRGSQVSLHAIDDGYAVMQALIARGVSAISARPTSCASASRRSTCATSTPWTRPSTSHQVL